MMPVPKPDAKAFSAAFTLVFRQGRSPPSCPMPDDAGLLNRIMDAAPDASPAACRDALVRVRRLSFDALETGRAFIEGEYSTGDGARAAALADLEQKNPGFSEPEYLTAFSVGLMWAGLQ
jgi:hypothetical protein